MLAEGVVERALFRRAAHAAGGYLVDVDVGVFVGGVVDVLAYGEGDGGVGNGFAEEPGYALLWDVRMAGKVVAVKELVEGYIPFPGYDRSHRRGICSEGMSVCQHVSMGGGIGGGEANHCPYSVEILERSFRWCCHC